MTSHDQTGLQKPGRMVEIQGPAIQEIFRGPVSRCVPRYLLQIKEEFLLLHPLPQGTKHSTWYVSSVSGIDRSIYTLSIYLDMDIYVSNYQWLFTEALVAYCKISIQYCSEYYSAVKKSEEALYL